MLQNNVREVMSLTTRFILQFGGRRGGGGRCVSHCKIQTVLWCLGINSATRTLKQDCSVWEEIPSLEHSKRIVVFGKKFRH